MNIWPTPTRSQPTSPGSGQTRLNLADRSARGSNSKIPVGSVSEHSWSNSGSSVQAESIVGVHLPRMSSPPCHAPLGCSQHRYYASSTFQGNSRSAAPRGGPNLVELGPTLADPGPSLAKLGQIRVEVGRLPSNSGRHRPKFGHGCGTSCAPTSRIRPNLMDFDRSGSLAAIG